MQQTHRREPGRMPCGDNIRRFRYHIPQPRHLRGHGRDDDGDGDHVHDPRDRDGDARARHRLHHSDDARALLHHALLLRFVQIRFPESSLLMLQQSASQTCEY